MRHIFLFNESNELPYANIRGIIPKFQIPNSKFQIPNSKFQKNPKPKFQIPKKKFHLVPTLRDRGQKKYDASIGELKPKRLNIVRIKYFSPKIYK